MSIERVAMPAQQPLARAKNFDEVNTGYSESDAALEASRVIQERQTEQENVIAFQACHVDCFAGEGGTCAGGAAEHCAADGEEDVGGVAVVARCEDCGAGDARGRTDGEGGGPDAGAEGRCGRELRRRR